MIDEGKRTAALTEVSLILAAVFWGTNYAATKFAAASVPQLAIVGLRFALGGMLLLGAVRLLEPKSRLARKDLLPMAALGCFGLVGAQTSFTFGVSMTTAANTGMIFATAPIWGLLLSLVLGLERPSAKGVVGVALSLAGVALVFGKGLGAPGTSVAGDLLVLLAAVCVGFYTVFSMSVLERYSPLAVAAYPTLFAIPVTLLASSPFLFSLDWGGVGTGTWAAIGYSGVFATAFTFAAWQRGISRIGANRVLVYQYLITLTGVTSGIIFFGERLGAGQILGGAVILVGVFLARRQ